jgi:hypothetical protein
MRNGEIEMPLKKLKKYSVFILSAALCQAAFSMEEEITAHKLAARLHYLDYMHEKLEWNLQTEINERADLIHYLKGDIYLYSEEFQLKAINPTYLEECISTTLSTLSDRLKWIEDFRKHSWGDMEGIGRKYENYPNIYKLSGEDLKKAWEKSNTSVYHLFQRFESLESEMKSIISICETYRIVGLSTEEEQLKWALEASDRDQK